MVQFNNSSDPSKWTEEQLNSWFEEGSFLNGLQFLPDESINRRVFAIHYHAYKEVWDRSFTFLRDTDLVNMPIGKVKIGNNLTAGAQEYMPRNHEDCRFETHRKFIDIQYIVSGKELIGLTNVKKTTVVEPYDTENDIEFEVGTEYTLLKAIPGRFFIFFPEDAHMPCMKDDEGKVRKIVIKVPVE